jgi:hypothetical protein
MVLGEQRTSYRKKVAGSLAIVLVAGAGAFAATSPALAQFIAVGNQYNVEGVVTTVNDHQSMTIQTDGTAPLFINIRHAHIGGGSLQTGELVNIRATKSGGVITAHNVRIENGGQTGYGASGPVIINQATVVSFTGNTLVVRHRGNDITFQVTSSTRFVGGGRGNVDAGDSVLVVGSDNGSAFVADTVVVFKQNHGHGHGQGDDPDNDRDDD